MGLDGLQDLLGRLNGKDEEQLGKEAESRDKLRKEVIVSQRYGMRFVRGETYVSSDIEALLKRIEGEKKHPEEGERKIKEEGEGESDGEPIKAEDTELSSVRAKKEKKPKREKSSSKSASVTPAGTDSEKSFGKRKRTHDDDSSRTAKEEKPNKEKALKMSKKSKNGETREERKTRREREKSEKGARKAGKINKKRKSSSDSAPSGTATPSYSALVGRQAVRHRYIAAKRSSVMDAKALNEVCLILVVLIDFRLLIGHYRFS